MSRISQHISYREAVRSNTAKRYGIKNEPNSLELNNMKRVATKVFEPMRKHFGVPIYISSFFRSWKLNKKVGGSRTSDHPEGKAIDVDDVLGGVTNAEMFYYILDNLDFDQLIWEYGDVHNPSWVHFSYDNPFRNRKQALRAERYTTVWGFRRTRYVPFVDLRQKL